MKHEDELLAKWLSGEVTDEQVIQAEGVESLEGLKRLVTAMDNWSMPAYNAAKSLKEFKANRQPRSSKIRKINWRAVGVVAASAAILIVAWFAFFKTNDIILTAEHGETQNFVFSDGSKVWLNDGSQIVYNGKDWISQRSIKLTGEALFEVTKGSPFVVTTHLGSVTVLGTQFNARAWGDNLHVECYEGRVRVNIDSQETILTANESVRSAGGTLLTKQDFTHASPSWQNATSRFYSEKLITVCEELERQFDIKIKLKDADRVFTGTFNHSDLDAALNNICKPLELTYRVSTDKKSVVIE